jgi:hypothetical protein
LITEPIPTETARLPSLDALCHPFQGSKLNGMWEAIYLKNNEVMEIGEIWDLSLAGKNAACMQYDMVLILSRELNKGDKSSTGSP